MCTDGSQEALAVASAVALLAVALAVSTVTLGRLESGRGSGRFGMYGGDSRACVIFCTCDSPRIQLSV